MRSSRKKSAERALEAQPVETSTGAPALATENPFRRDLATPEALLRAAGIETDAAAHNANRRLNAISILVPMAGTVAALAALPVIQPGAVTWGVFAIFFILNGFGVTMGLHRYFTHRSFETSPVVAGALAVMGTWAFQGPIARWVADHRRHHRFSDKNFDPHSPYTNDQGPISSPLKGFLHAHLFWMFTGLRSSEVRYAADIEKSSVARWFSRHYWPVAASGIALPALAGYLLGGVSEMWACGLWAGFFRVALLHQLTWSVNSFGHMLGRRREGAKDEARDNPVLALLILGEGLHGFHHQFPNAAVKSPAQFDATGALIGLLERAGLVWGVNRVAVEDQR